MALVERFETFMFNLTSVEGIDLIELDEPDRKNKKADYLAMGRKIVIEQKCITQDQAIKIPNEVENFSTSDEYPFFYGQRDLNLVIGKLPIKDELKRNIYSKLTKVLESYLRQANKQIESTGNIFGLDVTCGILVLLNDNVKILSPEVVATRIQQRLKETNNGSSRFPKIDYVIFISETHNIGGVPLIVVIEGINSSKFSSEISDYIDYLIHAWGQFNGGGVTKFEDAASYFKKCEENEKLIPEKMTRSEARILSYRENRYMKSWTNDQVARGTATLIDNMKPFVMKGGPSLPTDELGELMMQFGDFIEETNLRGMDIREFKQYHRR